MGTMADSETYNGYANRETWAFNLHWLNDQSLYGDTLEHARYIVEQDALEDPDNPPSDRELGEAVVTFWRDAIDEYRSELPTMQLPEALAMFEREVGSWWRIDYREVGEAVRESLDAES